MSEESVAMELGRSGDGPGTPAPPPSALGYGASLHAYDIGVLVVYFVFVIVVGIWVSLAQIEAWQGIEGGVHREGEWGQGQEGGKVIGSPSLHTPFVAEARKGM